MTGLWLTTASAAADTRGTTSGADCELAELETRDTGKIVRETRSQIGYIAEYYRYFGGLADKLQGAYLPIDKADMEVTLRREPIGVVAAVVPWNSQQFLTAVKLGPALAAGCTIVVKASEDGPAPLLALARLVHEAGFPKGAGNVITGGRAVRPLPSVNGCTSETTNVASAARFTGVAALMMRIACTQRATCAEAVEEAREWVESGTCAPQCLSRW